MSPSSENQNLHFVMVSYVRYFPSFPCRRFVQYSEMQMEHKSYSPQYNNCHLHILFENVKVFMETRRLLIK